MISCSAEYISGNFCRVFLQTNSCESMELYVQEDSEDSIGEILGMEMNRLLDIKVIIGLLR